MPKFTLKYKSIIILFTVLLGSGCGSSEKDVNDVFVQEALQSSNITAIFVRSTLLHSKDHQLSYEMFYADIEGNLQHSIEDGMNTIIQFSQVGGIDTSSILNIDAHKLLDKTTGSFSPKERTPAYEISEERKHYSDIYLLTSTSSALYFRFAQNAVPESIKEIIESIRSQSLMHTVVLDRADSDFLRVFALSPETVRGLNSPELFTSIDSISIDFLAQELQNGLKHPYKLISMPSGTNPLPKIRPNFIAGRDVILVKTRMGEFQIRSYK